MTASGQSVLSTFQCQEDQPRRLLLDLNQPEQLQTAFQSLAFKKYLNID